ncbi:cytochrome C assembly family protein [Pajaroellobacter abortibovis]|uniref:cytochrome C assembly family protein n=1 Tax=Pajaroellobacter abortibovis TaxID=1882918 RepID=UPI0012EBDD42|nr:cytochrome c biogenesis protein CcsA [Pajaroellobacter abortibovis]
MDPNSADICFGMAVAAYSASTLSFFKYLIRNRRDKRPAAVATFCLGVGVVFHFFYLGVVSLSSHACPIEGAPVLISMMSMLDCTLYLILRRFYRLDGIGAFLTLLCLVIFLASRLIHPEVLKGGWEEAAHTKSLLLPIHATANLFGTAFLMLAFVVAIAYLIQEKGLKEKRFKMIFEKLPPLDFLDQAEGVFLYAAFPLLTLGMLTGIADKRVVVFHLANILRVVFGVISWLLVGGFLSLRVIKGWRGRRIAYGTILGFGFIVIIFCFYLLRQESSPWVLKGGAA